MATHAQPTAGFHELWQHSILCHLGAHFLKNQQPLWIVGSNLGFADWQHSRDTRTWLTRTHDNIFFDAHLQVLYRDTTQYPGILKAWRPHLHSNASILYSETDTSAQYSLLQQFQGDPQVEYFPDNGLRLLEDLGTHHHTSPIQLLLAAEWFSDTDIENQVAALKKLTHSPSAFCAAIRYPAEQHFIETLFASLRRHQFHHVLIIRTEHEDPQAPASEMMIINPPAHYEKLLRGAAKALVHQLGYHDLANVDIFYLLNLPKPDTIQTETSISDSQLEQVEKFIEEGHRKSGLMIDQRIAEKSPHGEGHGMGLEEHPLLADLPEGVAPNLSNNAAANPQADDQADKRESELTLQLQQRLQNRLAAGKSATPMPTLRR